VEVVDLPMKRSAATDSGDVGETITNALPQQKRRRRRTKGAMDSRGVIFIAAILQNARWK
jgi:hypothetical protein